MSIALVETLSVSGQAELPDLVVNSVIKNIRTLARRAFESAASWRTRGAAASANRWRWIRFPPRSISPTAFCAVKQTTSLVALLRALATVRKLRAPIATTCTRRTFTTYQAVAQATSQPFLLVIDGRTACAPTALSAFATLGRCPPARAC